MPNIRQQRDRRTKVRMAAGIAAVMLFTIAVRMAYAREIGLETLPDPVRPSTEVSTNILFRADGRTVRGYEISLSFVGTESNCVEIALGRDADGDGVLAPDETGAAFGWRRGDLFVEGGEARLRVPSATANAALSTMVLDVDSNRSPSVGRVSFSHGGVPLFADVFAGNPSWAYDPSWDTLRLTRRGVDAADEGGTARTDLRPFVLRVR